MSIVLAREDYWELLVAIAAGIVQGIVEWLPVSSQGNLSLFLTAIGTEPDAALQLALFLQFGTTLSSAAYYRADIIESLRTIPTWQPRSAFEKENALPSFIVIASLVTGVIGLPVYIVAIDVVSELSGGVFIAVIGILLILTGIAQIASESVSLADRTEPTLTDAVLIGGLQGLAILPGISRSGITTSGLLFRSYDPPAAFRLSFLLSIPAGIGAGLLILVTEGGIPGVNLVSAVVALAMSAIVGYVTIGTLIRIVERVPFWLVCFGLGGLAIVGGGGVAVLTA